MGRVYLAVQPAIGSRVAIKILSDQCARNPELLERFFAEARAVNLVHHESIVSVLDLSQLPDGRPFIVMEYIEGDTLAAVARGGPVALGGLVQVMTEVLSALAAAHAIGIVHRDLKPDNVLVTAEGHAKVLDFGIAKLAPELQQQLSPRTRTGALLGTPQYMAPEQISGAGAVDPRTDVYAAGVVLYELATGRQPFIGETLFDLMRAHLEQPPQPPRALRADLPPALEQVILTALAKRPDDRFASAAAMAQALQQSAAALPAAQWRALSSRTRLPGGGSRTAAGPELPLAYRQTQPVGPSPTVARSRRQLIAGAVAVVAVLVGLAVVALLRRAGGGPPAVALAGGPAPAGSAAAADSPAAASGSAGSAAATASGPGGSPTAAAGSGGSPTTSAAGSASGASGSAGPVPPRGPGAHRRTAGAGAKSASPAGGPPAAGAATAPSSAGPTVVNGGSAADHGVFIGPNVVTGPNVVVGSATPLPAPGGPAARDEISRPADYDPRRFDPVAYLPRAQNLARELLPDAQLTSFEFDPVFSDGRVDLTLDGRDREYEFRSPERSAFPAGRPRNMPIDRKCRVHVEIGVRAATARVLTSDSCDARVVRAPRCSLASVWKRALAAGTPGDLVARIGWLHDETWFFDVDLAGVGGGVTSFADRCP